MRSNTADRFYGSVRAKVLTYGIRSWLFRYRKDKKEKKTTETWENNWTTSTHVTGDFFRLWVILLETPRGDEISRLSFTLFCCKPPFFCIHKKRRFTVLLCHSVTSRSTKNYFTGSFIIGCLYSEWLGTLSLCTVSIDRTFSHSKNVNQSGALTAPITFFRGLFCCSVKKPFHRAQDKPSEPPRCASKKPRVESWVEVSVFWLCNVLSTMKFVCTKQTNPDTSDLEPGSEKLFRVEIGLDTVSHKRTTKREEYTRYSAHSNNGRDQVDNSEWNKNIRIDLFWK